VISVVASVAMAGDGTGKLTLGRGHSAAGRVLQATYAGARFNARRRVW
jgi:hypothetical protein